MAFTINTFIANAKNTNYSSSSIANCKWSDCYCLSFKITKHDFHFN